MELRDGSERTRPATVNHTGRRSGRALFSVVVAVFLLVLASYEGALAQDPYALTQSIVGSSNATVYCMSAYASNLTANGTAAGYRGLLAWGTDEGYARLHRVAPSRDYPYNVTFEATLLAELNLGAAVRGVALAANGTLLVVGAEDGKVRVYGVASNGSLQLQRTLDAGGSVHGMAASADGSLIVAGTFSNTVTAWNASGVVWTRSDVLGGGVLGIAISPNGALVAATAAIATNNTKLLSAATGADVAVLAGHTAWVNGVAFSPNGTLLATAAYTSDGTVKFWSVPSGASLYTQAPETAGTSVKGVSFAPDSSYVVAVDNAYNVRFLSTLRLGARARPDLSLTRRLQSVVLSPDGAWLAIGYNSMDTATAGGDAGYLQIRTLLTPVPIVLPYVDPLLAFNASRSLLNCSSDADGGFALPHAPVACTFYPRNGRGAPVAVDAAAFSVGASPAANTTAPYGVVLGAEWAASNATSLPFTARFASAGAAAAAVWRRYANATVVNGTATTVNLTELAGTRSLTVLAYPDATSTLACTPQTVYVDTVTLCRATFRLAGSPAPTLLAAVGAASMASSEAGAVLNFTAAARESGASGPISAAVFTVGAMGVQGIVPARAVVALPLVSALSGPLASIPANISVAPSYLPPVPDFRGDFADKVYLPMKSFVVDGLYSVGSKWRDPATGVWVTRDVQTCTWSLAPAPGNNRKVDAADWTADGEMSATFTWRKPRVGAYVLSMEVLDWSGSKGSLSRTFLVAPPKNWAVEIKLDIGFEEFRLYYPSANSPAFVAVLAKAAGVDVKQLYDLSYRSGSTIISFKSFRLPNQDMNAYRNGFLALTSSPFASAFGFPALAFSKSEFEMSDADATRAVKVTVPENVRAVKGSANVTRIPASASTDVPLLDLFWRQISGPASLSAAFSGIALDPTDAGFTVPSTAPLGIYLLSLTASDAFGNDDTARVVLQIVPPDNATAAAETYTTARAVANAMTGAAAAVGGITAATAAAQVVGGTQAAMSGGGGANINAEGGMGGTGDQQAGADGGGGDGGTGDGGGGAGGETDADADRDQTLDAGGANRHRRGATPVATGGGVGGPSGASMAAAAVGGIAVGAAIASAVSGAPQGPEPTLEEQKAAIAMAEAKKRGDAQRKAAADAAAAAGGPRAGAGPAELVPSEGGRPSEGSGAGLLGETEEEKAARAEMERLAKKRAKNEDIWAKVGKVLQGVMGIFGHLSFLASTAYVGGAATPPGYTDMASSLSWALMKPSQGPWGRGQGTGTKVVEETVVVPVAAARHLLGAASNATTTRTVYRTVTYYTTADGWWDDFLSVMFWSGILVAFVLFCRIVMYVGCKFLFKSKTAGVVPGGIKWPYIDLMIFMLLLPGLSLFLGLVASTQTGGKRALALCILALPVCFMVWTTYMAWTRIHRRRTVVFVRYRRRMDRGLPSNRDLERGGGGAVDTLLGTPMSALRNGKRGSLFDSAEQRRAFEEAGDGEELEGELVRDIDDDSVESGSSSGDSDDSAYTVGGGTFAVAGGGTGLRLAEVNSSLAKKAEPALARRKRRRRGCYRAFIHSWKRMQRLASKGAWRATERDKEEFKELYEPVFNEFCFRRFAFLGQLVDMTKKLATSLTIGFYGQDQSNTALYIELLVLFCYSALHLCFLVVIRPHRDRIENTIQIMATSAEATIFILMWVALGRNGSANDGITTGLLAINIGVTLLLTLNQLRSLVTLFELLGDGARFATRKPREKRRRRRAAERAEEERITAEAKARAPKETSLGDPWGRLYLTTKTGEVKYKPEIKRAAMYPQSIEADLAGLGGAAVEARPATRGLVVSEHADASLEPAARRTPQRVRDVSL